MTVYRTDDGEPISAAVVRALGAVTDTPVQEVPALYDSVDPDALDALFRDRDAEGEVRFEHAGHRVTVHSSGEIRLEKAMDGTA